MPTALYALLVLAADTEGGPASPFEVNFGLIFWAWVVFLILFWVLRKYAWPQIVSATEERERTIRRQLEEAERLHAEARTAHQEAERLASEARASAQTMLAEARAVSEKERTLAIEKLRQEQDALLERARRDIADERDRAAVMLRTEAVDLALAAAGRLIEARLDNEADRKLVTSYLSSVEAVR